MDLDFEEVVDAVPTTGIAHPNRRRAGRVEPPIAPFDPTRM